MDLRVVVVMSADIQHFYSDRGHPLVWWLRNMKEPRPVLTVENYCKWYGLYLVHPDGRVEEIPFPDEPEDTKHHTPYVDHVPNPVVVEAFAERMNYHLDERAHEMMIGRWELEART